MLKIQRILCPTDFSEFSAKAYEYAQSLAQHYQAKLFLRHVVQPLTTAYPYYAFPDSINEIAWNLHAHAEKQLHEFLQHHAGNETSVQCIAQQGLVTDTILSFAER